MVLSQEVQEMARSVKNHFPEEQLEAFRNHLPGQANTLHEQVVDLSINFKLTIRQAAAVALAYNLYLL